MFFSSLSCVCWLLCFWLRNFNWLKVFLNLLTDILLLFAKGQYLVVLTLFLTINNEKTDKHCGKLLQLLFALAIAPCKRFVVSQSKLTVNQRSGETVLIDSVTGKNPLPLLRILSRSRWENYPSLLNIPLTVLRQTNSNKLQRQNWIIIKFD